MDLQNQQKLEDKRPKLPPEYFFDEFLGLDIDVALPEAATVREREIPSE